MVANVSFREQVRRTWNGIRSTPALSNPSGHRARTMGADMNANETTLLMGREHTTSTSRHSRHGPLWDILRNRHYTPGQRSAQLWVQWPANVWHVIKLSLLSNWINVFLPSVPLGIVAGHLEWGPTTVFTLNFLSIIPLAALLSFATEEISLQVGGTLGGLLNATFGNAVELIVSVIALQAGQIEIVQASMLGSILSNLLLVMGMCFFLGGIYNMSEIGPDGQRTGVEQIFATGTAQSTCSLMALSSGSLVLPAALYNSLTRADDQDKADSILLLSRGTAIVLLLLYCLYLFFQLHTHGNLFEPAETLLVATLESGSTEAEREVGADEDKDEGSLSMWAALILLVVVTLVISVCADYLVNSIDAIVSTGKISKSFIGLILIPIVGNAAEHVTACVMAVKNKMDLAMGVAIGSSIQISLLVTPALVILGWIMHQPMSLHFELFETIAFALSVIIVASMVQDGRSNYLEGAMLMGFYFIIALAFWASPPDAF